MNRVDYCGNLIYENDTLKQVLIDGGYVTFNGSSPQYHFYVQDHLGNNRVVCNSSGTIEQVNHYYPFGGLFGESTNDEVQRYKYNGKELDRMHGLNWCDYHARQYDGAGVRFTSMDSKCENYYHISPYAYCMGNPVNAVDPDGNVVIPVHGTWSGPKTWKDLKSILNATNNLFGDKTLGKPFKWSGSNYSYKRTEAAIELIGNIRTSLKNFDDSEPITLVGHSHGGNVCIEAINRMMKMDDFKDRKFNLLTINTPVRDDYQLSEKASERVNHVNVYDPKDPVQVCGGKTTVGGISAGIGAANRVFKNARNIKVDNPQGIVQFKRRNDPTCLTPGCYYQNPVEVHGGDYHNSHNRVQDWIKYTEE